ncbi:MAG TPA: inorganic diphosphatase [Candidatus Bathyarchaeia archaeon]|nr:inorganic diphosphatase [Candidatus Bathyarchaeia archaeon]
MRLHQLSAGEDPPSMINVVIEVPSGSSVKYEIDIETGFVFVDRLLYTATHYPFNYGFIPQTREEDGDPLDVVVLTQLSVYPMSVIRSRPIGMLVTEDENGRDVKIVAAPGKEVDPYYADVEDLAQVPGFTRNQIEHFFSKYKELEPSKFVKVIGWETKESAKKKISEAIARYNSPSKSG